MSQFGLPANYVQQRAGAYFDDSPFASADIIHPPEVYEAADYFLRATGRTTIIDVGCGCARKLRKVGAECHIGVDFGSNISWCRAQFGAWGEWREVDRSQEACVSMAELASERSVVVCADVVEHLIDPRPLISLLEACYRRGAIVITSTPDRIRVRGEDHKGPPFNPCHIRKWL